MAMFECNVNSNLGINPHEKLDLTINAYNSVITAERRGIIMWHATTGGNVKVNDITYTSPNNDFTSILMFNKGDRLEYLGPKNTASWDCRIVYI